MSDIPTHGAESATPTASPGILLSNERVKRGLSLQEVADQLKLSRKQLEAIENDEYDKLPGPAFARGFVRNYAKLLGLDAALLNAALDAYVPMPMVNPRPAPVEAPSREPARPVEPTPEPRPRQPLNPLLIKGAIAVVVLVLLLMVSYRMVTQGGSVSPAPLPATLPSPASQAAVSTPLVEAPAPQAAVTPAPVSAPAPVTSAPIPEAKPAELPTPATQAAVSDSGAGEVVLRAKETAWVSLIDAKGKKLVYGQVTGEKRVSGTPPYKLIIGNAQQVELQYKGQGVPLADKTKGSTARVELQ